jgi:hypothetical protein
MDINTHLNRNAGQSQGESLKTAYDQLCMSYRAIDDFRAKLLGFLPLASGTGLFLLLTNLTPERQRFLGPIGAFGFLVTLGLFSYEIYGITKCGALIKTGKWMEGLLHINGQFISRPREVAHLIDEPFAAGIIYPTVLAAWAYLALVFTQPEAAWATAILVVVVGFAGTLTYDILLRKQLGQAQADNRDSGHEKLQVGGQQTPS